MLGLDERWASEECELWLGVVQDCSKKGEKAPEKYLRTTADQRQPELIVCSRLHHAVECSPSFCGQRGKRRIVFDRFDRLLVGQWHLHAGIESVFRIEGFLDQR